MELKSKHSQFVVPYGLTVEEVENTMRYLAWESPTACYEQDSQGSMLASCSYVKGAAGKGEGCIVGQALRNCGCQFVEDVRVNASTLFNASEWISIVQTAQDNGAPWAEAIARGDNQ